MSNYQIASAGNHRVFPKGHKVFMRHGPGFVCITLARTSAHTAEDVEAAVNFASTAKLGEYFELNPGNNTGRKPIIRKSGLFVGFTEPYPEAQQ